MYTYTWIEIIVNTIKIHLDGTMPRCGIAAVFSVIGPDCVVPG